MSRLNHSSRSHSNSEPSVEDIIETCLDEKVVLTIKKFEHCYETAPIPTSPFHFHSGMSNRFLTYEAALEFIALHCYRIHGKFTREHSRIYIPWCFVYNQIQKKYIPMSSFSNTIFISCFRKVEKYFSKFKTLH
jgi:hypothetical protein